MTTGTKFDVLGEYDGQPFYFARNLSLTVAKDMVKRKGGKVLIAGTKKEVK